MKDAEKEKAPESEAKEISVEEVYGEGYGDLHPSRKKLLDLVAKKNPDGLGEAINRVRDREAVLARTMPMLVIEDEGAEILEDVPEDLDDALGMVRAEGEEEPSPAADGYDTMTKKDLYDLAQKRGLPVTSRMRNEEMIAVLREDDAESEEEEEEEGAEVSPEEVDDE